MISNNTHPQYSETDLDILKIEFSQLITISEKYLFWESNFKISYAFWGRILINGYSGNFEIIPSGIEETQMLIKLILEEAIPVFWKRHDLRINVDLPVKLTSPRRFILTTLRRCKLTTYF